MNTLTIKQRYSLHSKIRHKDPVFYRGKTEVSLDFSSEEISSDGAIVLLEKIERKHKVLRYFGSLIPDSHNPLLITHSIEKLLKQRVFMLMQGYEDAYVRLLRSLQ